MSDTEWNKERIEEARTFASRLIDAYPFSGKMATDPKIAIPIVVAGRLLESLDEMERLQAEVAQLRKELDSRRTD